MSPDGTHVLLTGYSSTPHPYVLDTRTGKVYQLTGTPTDTNPSSQSGWTNNSRWLITLTDPRPDEH